MQGWMEMVDEGRTYVCNLFHVIDHFVIAFGLLAEPREEGFAIIDD